MRRIFVLASLAVSVAIAACGGDKPSITSPSGGTASNGAAVTPAVVTVVSGDGQSGVVGTTLSTPVVVKVTSANGTPVSGVTVTFVASPGDATITPSSAVTDANGQATATLTLGGARGSVQIVAAVQGTSVRATFTATATAPSANVACTAGTAATLAQGEAAPQSGTSLCVSGGSAGAEYALVPFNASTVAKTFASVTVQTAGITQVSSPTLGAPTTSGVAASIAASRGVSPALLAPPVVPADYAERLHARRVGELAPFVGAARDWYAARGASAGARRVVIPRNAAVGQLYTLNANGDQPCANPDYRAARVQAVTSKAIVLADTLDPVGGYTAADYQSIAATFDTLVDAVDTRNFGQPTDIDNNGHVLLFFTSSVNALTPRNSGEYIGGFFDSRDLFPTTAPRGQTSCGGSNVAEMFYLLVPDPSGMVNGNRFSKSFVTAVTLSTVAHEYQHLINSSRRLYVTRADFEETWLDEGLAHVAEELFFYARAHLGPRQDLDATTLRASPTTSTIFTDDAVANFDRLDLFLRNPSRNSPYADNDSLATRGATWSFLRWAADQQPAGSEPAIWQRLVNTQATGLANLQQVFGADIASQFRDWATALILDDVPGAPARYQFPSWNLRSIEGALNGDGTYSLSTVVLANGATRTVAVAGGSAAYLRFAVGAGQSGSVSWSALPANVTLTLVRLR